MQALSLHLNHALAERIAGAHPPGESLRVPGIQAFNRIFAKCLTVNGSSQKQHAHFTVCVQHGAADETLNHSIVGRFCDFILESRPEEYRADCAPGIADLLGIACWQPQGCSYLLTSFPPSAIILSSSSSIPLPKAFRKNASRLSTCKSQIWLQSPILSGEGYHPC